MAVSSAEFVAAMRQFSAAVNLITTGTGAHRAGLTATAAFSLTAEPPQIAVAVNRNASAHPAIVENGCFCVNTLPAGHEELARRFAGGVPASERFQTGSWTTLATGAPVLADALISLDCTVERAVDFNTHTLFVGRVEGLHKGVTSKPLLFVDGQWASLVPATPAELDHVTSFVRQSIDTIEQALGSADDVDTALGRFVREFTALNIAGQSTTQAHLSSELYASPAVLDRLNAMKRAFDERLLALIRKGVAEGRFAVDDPRLASFAIIGMIVWTYKWYRPDGRLAPAEIAEGLAELTRRVVGAGRAP